MTLSITRCIRVLVVVLSMLTTTGAFAERIVFQRAGSLYIAGSDGKNVRRLFEIGNAPTIAWAPSPDGRRIAWYTYKQPDTGSVLRNTPITVWISDLYGRRRKVLFSTTDLRDLQGNRIRSTWTGRAVPLGEWVPISLAWGPGGKTLYLSCTRLSKAREHATFIVDAMTGTAVVDADGRWKSIAPVVQVDAKFPLLVGVGYATIPSSQGDEGYFPLLLTDMPQSRTTTLMKSPFANGSPVPYRLAASPSLSPDTKTIVFSAIGDGLWQVDSEGRSYRRITDRLDDGSPRWSEDGVRLFFLSAGDTGGESTDLFSMTPPFSSGRRRLVLNTVDRYFLVPD